MGATRRFEGFEKGSFIRPTVLDNLGPENGD